MILHLVNDEKIINRTVRLFESAAPGKHLFVVFASSKRFKYVTPSASVISKADFFKRLKEAGFYGTGIEFEKDSVMVLLVTCSYQERDGRFVEGKLGMGISFEM